MSDSGWQPAVDNLQSQINSLNSQVSVLSGQEGSQAAQLVSLTSEVNALQTEVSTIQQQVAQDNLLADLSGVSVSNAFDTPALLSLNGNSVLQMPTSPSIDGKPFRITIFARVSHNGSNSPNFYGTLKLGNSLQSLTLGTASYIAASSSQTGTFNGLFFSAIDFVWDSVSQKLFVLERNEFSQRTSLGFVSGLGTPAGVEQDGFDVASQSALQFVFSAQWNNVSNPTTITLSQFKLSLI